MVPLVSNQEQPGRAFMTDEQLALARLAKINYHSAEYLKSMVAAMMKGMLEDYSSVTDLGVHHDLTKPDRPSFRVKRRTVPNTTRRKINYDTLRERFPEVYREAVTVTPPDRKYVINYSRAHSGLWTALRVQAIENTRAYWEDRTKSVNWTSRAERTRVLYDVKQGYVKAEARNQGAREELSRLLENSDYESGWLWVPDGDSYISTKLHGPKRSVDWDAMAKYPAAMELVTRVPVSGYTTIAFTRIVEDENEGDKQPFEGY